MFKDKVVVITGGTRGIGFETAKQFLLKGAKVAIFGRSKTGFPIKVKELKEETKNPNIIGDNPNIASEEELQKAFKKVAKKFGKIDVVICNAGISSSTPIEKYTESEMNAIIDVNIKGVYLCSKIAVPYLKETKGVLLSTSSMVSFYGQRSGCLYPMSKFAMNGLTKSLARELAPFGVRVNSVAPGITETDMVKNLPEEMIKPLIASIPLGRMAQPKDIANAFMFLASDYASYITGEVLQVDGAMMS